MKKKCQVPDGTEKITENKQKKNKRKNISDNFKKLMINKRMKM